MANVMHEFHQEREINVISGLHAISTCHVVKFMPLSGVGVLG
jgi:hypothetical protein